MNWNADRHKSIMSWMASADVANVLSNIPEHADGHVMDRAGWTPLHRAAQLGLSCSSVFALIGQGINPHVLTPEGMTATDLARREGHMKLLKELSRHHCCKVGNILVVVAIVTITFIIIIIIVITKAPFAAKLLQRTLQNFTYS